MGLDAEMFLDDDDNADVLPTAKNASTIDGLPPRDASLNYSLEEFPLLDLIRSDTGEQGRESGDYVAFHNCPVCGHEDCFRYYPATNTCFCFGANGEVGGSAIDYLVHSHNMSVPQATAKVRHVTCRELVKPMNAARGSAGIGSAAQPQAGEWMPPWEHAMASNPPDRSPQFITGLLRRGHMLTLIARGKVGKTASLEELAAMAACDGTWDWLGFQLQSTGERVLYIDPECDPRSTHANISKVACTIDATRSTETCAMVDDRVLIWNLRGKAETMEDVVTNAQKAADHGERFGLVIFDSMSALFPKGSDENASADVRALLANAMNACKLLGDATCVIAHHTGKGSLAERDAGDWARGSVAWSDVPDACISMAEIVPPGGDQSDVMAALGDGVTAVAIQTPQIREFKNLQETRHLLFVHPRHYADSEGRTGGWVIKGTQNRGGQISAQHADERAARCVAAVAAELARRKADHMTLTDAISVASAVVGGPMKGQTLKQYVGRASGVLEIRTPSKQRCEVWISDAGQLSGVGGGQ